MQNKMKKFSSISLFLLIMIGLVEVGMLYIIFTFPETESTNSMIKTLLLVFLLLIFFTVGRELYHSIMRKKFPVR